MLVSKLVKNKDKSGEKNPIGHNKLSILFIDDQVNDEETIFTWNGLCKKFSPLSCLAQKSLCSACSVAIGASDYRLHHLSIYSFHMGNIFLSLSNILKLGNLTCVLVLGKEHSYGKILLSWTWYPFNSYIVDFGPGLIMYSVSTQIGLWDTKHVLFFFFLALE